MRLKRNGLAIQSHTENLFEDVNFFPDFDNEFSNEQASSVHMHRPSLSLMPEQSYFRNQQKDNTDMNNLYESSESNDEVTQRQIRNQTKINSLALSLSRQHSAMAKPGSSKKPSRNNDSYEEYGDSSDDKNGESSDDDDDSDEPKRILVKIRPIDEVDRTNTATPDLLNQISKNLKLKFESSEKVQKIKRKTYIRKIRNSFKDQNNNTAELKEETETAISGPESFQQQQQLGAKVNDYFKSKAANESSLQEPTSLFDFNFDSYDSRKESIIKHDPSFASPPPLPPLPPDFRIYEKLTALKNNRNSITGGGGANFSSLRINEPDYMSSSPPNENSINNNFSYLSGHYSQVDTNYLTLSLTGGDLESSISKSLYDTANSNDEMTF